MKQAHENTLMLIFIIITIIIIIVTTIIVYCRLFFGTPCSILYSINSISSPKLTFKSWILTSEKSSTSCPNRGEGGNLDKIQKNSRLFVSQSLYTQHTAQGANKPTPLCILCEYFLYSSDPSQFCVVETIWSSHWTSIFVESHAIYQKPAKPFQKTYWNSVTVVQILPERGC